MSSSITIKKLRCEYQNDPIGIDSKRPRLSWQLTSTRRNMRQTAYRILVADDVAVLEQNKGNVWDSKRVTSGQSNQIRFDGEELTSGKRYFWKVLIWDGQDKRTDWSPTAFWEMGLLNHKDWKIGWISWIIRIANNLLI